MTFQHPGLLALLPLSLLPVIFHLLGQRLRREILFPWIRLLMTTEQEGRYRRRLIEWLILVLRVLALAFPILALAGPRWGRTLPIRTIAVDVSHSMNAYASRLPSVLRDLHQQYPEAQLRYFADRWLPRYGLTDLGTDYRPLNDLQGNTLVITDLQRAGFRVPLKPHGTMYFLTLAPPPPNVAITAVHTPSPIYLQGIPLRIDVTLTNYADTVERRVLVLRGKTEQRKNVEIPPHGDLRESFQTLPTPDGVLWVELLPHDAFPGDDRRAVAFSPIPKTKVALIGDPTRALTSLLVPEHTPTPFVVTTFQKTPPPKRLEAFDLIIFVHCKPPRFQAFLSYFQSLNKPLIFFDTTQAIASNSQGTPRNLQVQGYPVRALSLIGREGQVVLKSDEGVPIGVQQGRTLWLGFSPDPKSDWILSGEFVMFFYTSLMHILQAPLHYAQVGVGETVRIHLGPQKGMPKVWHGDQEVAGQWSLKGVLTFVPMEAGIYRVVSDEGKPLAWVAAWVPVQESDPARVRKDDLQSWAGDRVQWVTPGEVVTRHQGPNPVVLFLMLALGALALEALLVRWFTSQ